MSMRLLSFITLFLFALPLHATSEKSVSHSQKSASYSDDTTHELWRKLCLPIQPTADGITHFIKKTYNMPEYGQDFLPNDFMHLEQLLNHALRTNQPRSYVQAIIRLFANKLKSSEYVNSYALAHLLEQMPALLHKQYAQNNTLALEQLHKKINTILYETFLDKFNDFKHNPTTFFDTLALEIANTTQAQLQKSSDISVEELRKTTLIFLEIALSKLIWSPEDGIQSWHCVKKISAELVTLFDYDIITDPDDLNDLFITLNERYAFFLDLTSSALTPSFFASVREDLSMDIPLMLSMDEQEEDIEAKYQRFQRALILAEAKSQAFAHGIVTR